MKSENEESLLTSSKEKVGNCFHCHREAGWNSPALDPEGNLWCDDCKNNDRSGIQFRTIDQFTKNGNYVFDGGVSFNGVVVWESKMTWSEGGSRSVKLTEAEKEMTPLEIAILIDKEHNIDEITRCTGCGARMKNDEIAGYPLFAGVNCKTCWDKHQQSLESQRKSGYVCPRCREPYNNCCC
jgi:hypothetical protein